MDDLISRKAAIDVMLTAIDDDWEPDYATDRMNELPSVQPEETRHAYEQGRIQGHVEMRTELLMQLKKIVGDEVWLNINT